MVRLLKKGFFCDYYLMVKVEEVVVFGNNKVVIKIWLRRFIIFLNFIGLIFGVYNGKKYILVYVIE